MKLSICAMLYAVLSSKKMCPEKCIVDDLKKEIINLM